MPCEPLSIATGILGLAFCCSEALGISSRVKSGCASITESCYMAGKTFYDCHCKNECEEEPVEIEMVDLSKKDISGTVKLKKIIEERNK